MSGAKVLFSPGVLRRAQVSSARTRSCIGCHSRSTSKDIRSCTPSTSHQHWSGPLYLGGTALGLRGPTRHMQSCTRASPSAPSAGRDELSGGTQQAAVRATPWQPVPQEDKLADKKVTVEEEDGSQYETTVGSLVDEYVGWCNEHLAIEPYIQVDRGVNDLPCVRLWHPNGSEATVYLHGACVTSWTKPNGSDMLYLIPNNTFDGLKPIKGGIPISFPQYRRGVLPTDGFLQDAHWSLVDAFLGPPDYYDPTPSVTLYTEATEQTKEIWPFDFEAFYTVTLCEEHDFSDKLFEDIDIGPEPEPDPEDEWGHEENEDTEDDEGKTVLQLTCRLEIRNTDTRPFTFTSGLRTHFAIKDLNSHKGFVRTLGLGGKYVYDWAPDPTGNQPVLTVEDQDYLEFGDVKVDRLYVDAESDKGDVFFCPGDRTHFRLINSMGFRDVGALHPITTQPEACRHHVALPAARLAIPVQLYPGEVWTGEMTLRCFDHYWETPIFDKSLQPIPSKKRSSF